MSDTLTIVTNNVPRNLLYWYELTAKEQAEFDYLDTENKRNDAEFVRYNGWTYDLAEFMACPSSDRATPQMRDAGFHKWSGYHSDSFFSGILVRYVDNFERVVMGRYLLS
jgi:hypothetical protein